MIRYQSIEGPIYRYKLPSGKILNVKDEFAKKCPHEVRRMLSDEYVKHNYHNAFYQLAQEYGRCKREIAKLKEEKVFSTWEQTARLSGICHGIEMALDLLGFKLEPKRDSQDFYDVDFKETP